MSQEYSLQVLRHPWPLGIKARRNKLDEFVTRAPGKNGVENCHLTLSACQLLLKGIRIGIISHKELRTVSAYSMHFAECFEVKTFGTTAFFLRRLVRLPCFLTLAGRRPEDFVDSKGPS